MKRGDSILSNWHLLIDDASFSGLEFFKRIEAAVKERQVPQVTFSRKDFRETGILSDKRTYLRLRKGNLIFDIGAAPYGTGFYFSWWLLRKRTRFAWLYLLGFVVIELFAVYATLFLGIGMMLGAYTWPAIGAVVIITFIILGLLARAGAFGPEENILALPILGWLFEKIFSPVTYHSMDRAIMYRESIRRAVNEALNATLADQGMQALSEEQMQLEDRMSAS